MPNEAVALLTVRVGEPLGASRGGWKAEVPFTLCEGLAALTNKCISRFHLIAANQTSGGKKLVLPGDHALYMKRTKHDTQDRYIKLSDDNFVDTLAYRWNVMTANDILQVTSFRYELFLYVRNQSSSTTQIHRATAQRVENARLRRLTFEATNAVRLGPIAGHHVDIVNARQIDDNAVFEVPEDNTTRQAMALDQMMTEHVSSAITSGEPETAMISVSISGQWIQLEVNVVSLRRAIGFPDHAIFTRGIFHEFRPTEATNGAMEDVDHNQPDQ